MTALKPKTKQQLKKEQARIAARAVHAAKCGAMDEERQRALARINPNVKAFMQHQLEVADKLPLGFSHKEHNDLIRQLRELDGLD